MNDDNSSGEVSGLGILTDDVEDLEDEDWEGDYEDEEEIAYGEEGSMDNPDIHIKWIADGCSTLAEVAERLRDYADYCQSMESEGWQLSQPVDNSHGFVNWVKEGSPPPQSESDE